MNNDNQNETPIEGKNQGSSNPSVEGRRSLLKKIGVAAPALVTLTSRPAFGAGFCSLSGFASINASGVARHSNQSCGLSQGGWKTPDSGAGSWPIGCIPNPPSQRMGYNGNNGFISTYNSNPTEFLDTRTIYGSTLFSEAFPSGLYSGYDSKPNSWPDDLTYTLHDALLYGDEIGREAAAAFLNAKAAELSNAYPFGNWHFSVEQVRTLFATLQWPAENISFNSLSDVASFFQAPQI